MTFKRNNIIICLLLLLTAQNSFVLAQQNNDRFRGVDFRDLHLSPVDSAVLRINSTWYSGWNQYGPVSSSNETFYNKWTKEKEKYYPIMKEAWKYCIDHQPYQVNLYKDGVLLNLWMFQVTKDTTYFNEMMKVYDLRISNIDSLNAHVRRVSDRSSVGGIMMQKARDYAKFVIGEDQVYSDAHAIEMFTSAAKVVRKDFEDGKKIGGDFDHGGLEYYLGFAINDYIKIKQDPNNQIQIPGRKKIDGLVDTAAIRRLHPRISSEQLENLQKHNQMVDSLERERDNLLDNPIKEVQDRYKFIKNVRDIQVNEIYKDYKDTLSTDGTDSVDVFLQKVIYPYEQMLQRCEYNLDMARINFNIQQLIDVETKYADEVVKHKQNLQEIEKMTNANSSKLKRLEEELKWASELIEVCKKTNDFDSDNLSYGFYEEVDDFYDKVLDIYDNIPKPSRPHDDNVNYTIAKKYHNKAHAISARITSDNAKYYALAIFYYNEAIRIDPANANKYKKSKNPLTGKAFKSEMFFAGIKEGQTLTVDGVTFKVVLR